MSSDQTAFTGARPPRFEGIDVLRGCAITMMIAYHFCFDLVHFRFATWRMLHEPGWIAWRTAILSSFLLLAGVSLVLRAQFKPAWRDFWRRWLQIFGAAVLVSAGSALMFPQSFIYFGVLHHLAAMLIVARLMLPLHHWNLPIGVAVIIAGATFGDPVFNPKWINWIGFVTERPYTEDYVPIFPWFGVILVGTALGWMWQARGFVGASRPTSWRDGLARPATHAMAFLGRWSLTTYLLHQPILIAALWLAMRLSPSPAA